YPKPEKGGDLINFDLPDISDSKSSSDDSDEPLSSTPNRDEDDKITRKPDSHSEWSNPLNLTGKEINIDLTFDDDIPMEDTGLENDSWFVNDVIDATRNEQKRRDGIIKEAESDLLIDLNSQDQESKYNDNNSSNFFGTINKDIAELNNSLYDSAAYPTISPMNHDLMNDSMDLYYFNKNESNNTLMSVSNDSRSHSSQVNGNHRYSTDTVSNHRSETNGSIMENMMDAKVTSQTDDIRSNSSTRDMSNDPPETNLTSPIITYDIKENWSTRTVVDDQEEISLSALQLSDGTCNPNGEDSKFSIFVETPLYGRKTLEMSVDEDADTVAANFCRTWQMLEYQEVLKGLILKKLRKKLRRRQRLAKQSNNQDAG
ncbi:4963_t:CDS:2, partial [Racocetra persica]